MRHPVRPNILVILTDQHFAEAMSCAGNPDVRTPALDGLAARGVRFERAYCTYPLCTPSRASLFSGMMPHEVGVYDNDDTGLDEQYRPIELGNVLSAGGYDCVYGGKWHLPEWSISEGHGFRQISPLSDWDLADRCIDYLQQPHDRPFLMVASFDNPHSICEWARQQPLPWGEVADVATKLCPNLPANFAIPAYESEAVAAERNPKPRSVFRGGSLSEDDWRHYRHAYYRLVEKVDAEIGRLLRGLREVGLEDETVVIFTSDHGDGMGAHRWNQKSVLYEESIRVPFIVSAPAGFAARCGRVDRSHLVSAGLDVAPTICDYAGIRPPSCWRGRSARPLLSDEPPEGWRSHLVIQTYFGPNIGGLHTEGRAVRTQRYKYTLYSWGKYREQLVDLDTDPGEMVNLAVEERHHGVLDEHRCLLAQWFEQSADPFVGHYAHPGRPALVPGQEYRRC